MDSTALIDAILAGACESNGKLRLDCAQAFALAREFKVELPKVGQICDEHNVRICKCQLGCFP